MCCLYWLMNKETALALIGQNLGRWRKIKCWEEGGKVGELPWSRQRWALGILAGNPQPRGDTQMG